jgi:hypothetical protein
MTIDRDPMRTIAALALNGYATETRTLEKILAFTWGQLCQRRGSTELATMLCKPELQDLRDLAAHAEAEAEPQAPF